MGDMMILPVAATRISREPHSRRASGFSGGMRYAAANSVTPHMATCCTLAGDRAFRNVLPAVDNGGSTTVYAAFCLLVFANFVLYGGIW